MDEKDIDALVEAKIREGRTIEYKEILDLRDDAAKLKLLNSVAALANTAGGTIYFGIREGRDEKKAHTGEPEEALGLASFDQEADYGRIEKILATGIEPTVGIMPEVIDGFPLGPVLALHVHQSWSGPHMVKDGRFYMRDNYGKRQMDYHMIRNSFTAFQSLVDEVRSFHNRRRNEVFSQEPFPSHGLLLLHALPISAFAPATRRSLSSAETVGKGFNSYRHNIDGLLVYRGLPGQAPLSGYVQIYRTGALERVATDFGMDYRGGSPLSFPVVNGDDVMSLIRETVAGFLKGQRSLAFQQPVAFMVSVAGVSGRKLLYGNDVMRHHIHLRDSPEAFDRDLLAFPELLCENLDEGASISKELLTLFWQAAGHSDPPPD